MRKVLLSAGPDEKVSQLWFKFGDEVRAVPIDSTGRVRLCGDAPSLQSEFALKDPLHIRLDGKRQRYASVRWSKLCWNGAGSSSEWPIPIEPGKFSAAPLHLCASEGRFKTLFSCTVVSLTEMVLLLSVMRLKLLTILCVECSIDESLSIVLFTPRADLEVELVATQESFLFLAESYGIGSLLKRLVGSLTKP